jgi:hypothetical protein
MNKSLLTVLGIAAVVLGFTALMLQRSIDPAPVSEISQQADITKGDVPQPPANAAEFDSHLDVALQELDAIPQ